MRRKIWALWLFWVIAVVADSLTSIKHVVFMMQSGRSFDHYFGTMAGVRGFADPNYQINNGTSVFEERLPHVIFPWAASYQGGGNQSYAQCLNMTEGIDGWVESHFAWDHGANDKFAMNSVNSMAYFTRNDIPTHFGIAEAWTVGDMYRQSIMSSVDPNRVFFFSGSAGIPNGPQQAGEGGPVLQDTSRQPGCYSPNLDCWPLNWHPIMKHLQDAGVTWQVYQDTPNQHGAVEILSGFEDFNVTKPGDPLYDRGLVMDDSNTLITFIKQAMNGTLPQVSWIISDEALSEGAGHRPQDGAWQQLAIIAATAGGDSRNTTALFISYDEAGGWFDHVPPTYSPNGTAGEWMQDPLGKFGYTIAGPGFRVPFYIISPWTIGGNVFTEHADHSSQIMFLETWLQALGHNVTTSEINPWRRQYMSNLVNAFDFTNPIYTVPNPPWPPTPPATGTALQTYCATQSPSVYPTPPVQSGASNPIKTEEGFKQVRGALTIGRYFVFELNGYALTNTGEGSIQTSEASAQHDEPAQQWVLIQYEAFGTAFKLINVFDKTYVENVEIVFLGGGLGYSLRSDATYWNIDTKGEFQFSSKPVGFNVFSVSHGNEAW